MWLVCFFFTFYALKINLKQLWFWHVHMTRGAGIPWDTNSIEQSRMLCSSQKSWTFWAAIIPGAAPLGSLNSVQCVQTNCLLFLHGRDKHEKINPISSKWQKNLYDISKWKMGKTIWCQAERICETETAILYSSFARQTFLMLHLCEASPSNYFSFPEYNMFFFKKINPKPCLL